MVSGLDIPAGMKNPTSGDFSVMINSVIAAQAGHDFISRGWEVATEGNLSDPHHFKRRRQQTWQYDSQLSLRRFAASSGYVPGKRLGKSCCHH